MVLGGLPTFRPGVAFNLPADFGSVLDGAEAQPEQPKECDEPPCVFVVPAAIRQEFANSNLPIADNAVFVDAEARKQTALGNPRELRDHPPSAKVGEFLVRGDDNEFRKGVAQ